MNGSDTPASNLMEQIAADAGQLSVGLSEVIDVVEELTGHVARQGSTSSELKRVPAARRQAGSALPSPAPPIGAQRHRRGALHRRELARARVRASLAEIRELAATVTGMEAAAGSACARPWPGWPGWPRRSVPSLGQTNLLARSERHHRGGARRRRRQGLRRGGQRGQGAVAQDRRGHHRDRRHPARPQRPGPEADRREHRRAAPRPPRWPTAPTPSPR